MITLDHLFLLSFSGAAIVIGLVICCKISEKFGKDELRNNHLLGYVCCLGMGGMLLSVVLGIVMGVLTLLRWI